MYDKLFTTLNKREVGYLLGMVINKWAAKTRDILDAVVGGHSPREFEESYFFVKIIFSYIGIEGAKLTCDPKYLSMGIYVTPITGHHSSSESVIDRASKSYIW